MQSQVEQMLKNSSTSRLAEVADFIDFVQQRDQDEHLRQDYADASEAAFSRVWNNDEDAIYDTL